MKEKIIVAMSGGVDSSVASLLLMEQGYEIIGVNLRTWEYEQSTQISKKKSCCSPEDIKDARDVGIDLNIAFHVIKMEDMFEKKVIKPFIEDYKNAKTPNPCVNCNSFVKFGSLFEKAKLLGIDKIATGHYAKIRKVDGRFAIENGKDSSKNQAYYLYGLSQEALKNTIFPLGDLEKSEVRAIARKAGLKTADKPESQEICFIPENDYKKFLDKKKVQKQKGNFKLKNGNILGTHTGKENYTVGQRKGLGISWSKPLYVLKIEENGDIILGEENETLCSEFFVENVIFQGLNPNKLKINETFESKIQIRYRHRPAKASVCYLGENKFKITPIEFIKSASPGQSAVFYPLEDNYVLMGGTIQK